MLKRYGFLLGLSSAFLAGWLLPEGGRAVRETGIAIRVLVALTLWVSGLTLDLKHLVRQAANLRAILASQATTYAVAPFLAVFFARLWAPGGPPAEIRGEFAEAMAIAAAQASTLASALALTMAAGGDRELALVITVVSNTATAVLTPLVLQVASGTQVALPILSMVGEMTLIVIAPVVLGYLTRRFLWEPSKRGMQIAGSIPPLAILVFVYTGVSAAAAELSQSAGLAGRFAAACACVHFTLLVWNWGLGALLRLGAPQRAALLFCASQKTLPNGIYIWDRYFGANPYGALPLVLYHLIQLVADTLLLPFVAERVRRETQRLRS